MGADLLLAFIPYPKMTEERQNQIGAIIDALTFEDIEEYVECDTRHGDVETDGRDAVLTDIKNDIRRIFDEYEQMPSSRSVGMVTIRGYTYLFTGGLSWGDSPSDVFDDITMLTQIDPIYRQLESWAVADYQTEG